MLATGIKRGDIMVIYDVYEFFKKKQINHKVITINEIEKIKSLNSKEVYEGIQEFFEYWNRDVKTK